jgi:hypothetical protein
MEALIQASSKYSSQLWKASFPIQSAVKVLSWQTLLKLLVGQI